MIPMMYKYEIIARARVKGLMKQITWPSNLARFGLSED